MQREKSNDSLHGRLCIISNKRTEKSIDFSSSIFDRQTETNGEIFACYSANNVTFDSRACAKREQLEQTWSRRALHGSRVEDQSPMFNQKATGYNAAPSPQQRLYCDIILYALLENRISKWMSHESKWLQHITIVTYSIKQSPTLSSYTVRISNRARPSAACAQSIRNTLSTFH